MRRRIYEADPVPETIRRADFLGDLRGVFVLAEPVESVLVVTDGTAVFLPSPGQGADLTEWLARWDGSRDGLAGVLYEWPTHMPLHLDLASTARLLAPPDDLAAAG